MRTGGEVDTSFLVFDETTLYLSLLDWWTFKKDNKLLSFKCKLYDWLSRLGGSSTSVLENDDDDDDILWVDVDWDSLEVEILNLEVTGELDILFNNWSMCFIEMFESESSRLILEVRSVSDLSNKRNIFIY